MTEGLLVLAIAGITKWLKDTIPGIQGWITPIVAAVLGLLAGIGHLEGLTPITGLLTALAAVGGLTAIDRFSNNG
jgi:hypothetical protein